jgi:hypothetical protein
MYYLTKEFLVILIINNDKKNIFPIKQENIFKIFVEMHKKIICLIYIYKKITLSSSFPFA